MTLVGIAAGIWLSSALLDDFEVTTQGLILATLVFWIAHILISFVALRILIREPSIAMAGILALLSTILALLVVNWLVDDVSISGTMTYILATLIIWITTTIADVIGGRMIRARRADR
jgi:hypothetical protein